MPSQRYLHVKASVVALVSRSITFCANLYSDHGSLTRALGFLGASNSCLDDTLTDAAIYATLLECYKVLLQGPDVPAPVCN